MATPNSRRIFSLGQKDVDDNSESQYESPLGPTAADNATSKRKGHSLGGRLRKPSRDFLWRGLEDEELGLNATPERPPIPSALAPSVSEALSNPLPVLPMIVLSIVMLGEFLSANVSTPFLLPMVKGFGVFNDEADVGFWTGILVSCFFITQFLTSLLWATIAEKHGIRAVLFVSLIGSSLTCFAFGTSTTLPQAMSVRLLQGVFAGAIGVGRGNVVTITDPSNEGRAYAILGFCWGFGGVAGAIIGGTFETPAEKWPSVFSQVALFVKYPYLLPTTIAASITLIGAILSLFLAHDGGPREGAIRLPVEKTLGIDTIPEEPTTPVEEHPPGVVDRLKHQVSRKLSGYFAKNTFGNQSDLPESGGGTPPVPLLTSVRRDSNNRIRTFSRTSRVDGSAYGYSSSYRNRVASVSQGLAGRRGSLASTVARRRMSNMRGAGGDRRESKGAEGGELNFAQRLLMANENVVTNIADLWVAAAINVDNDDVFFSESETEEGEDPFHDEEDDDDAILDSSSPSRPGRSSLSFNISRSLGVSTPVHQGNLSSIPHRPSTSGVRTQLGSPRRPSHRPSFAQVAGDTSERRVSSSVPAIFSHTGLRSPGALEQSDSLVHNTARRDPEGVRGEGLIPIYEGRNPSTPEPQVRTEAQADLAEEVAQPQPSLLSQLPVAIIIQYGLLALHSTTHDQVFLSYLVSKYPSGGLNLNPGHFAQLIALMSLASIAYQFYLYPNMGPPRGRFSHLAMFRVGSLLFIPAYLTVTLYRPLASADDDGNPILMAALVFSTALRYAGITFAYTSVAILLNYMSPPHLLGYANGIAQSIVSFARFVGPILGGYLWSVSVDGNPSGYPLGFLVCAGVTTLAVGHSFFIR